MEPEIVGALVGSAVSIVAVGVDRRLGRRQDRREQLEAAADALDRLSEPAYEHFATDPALRAHDLDGRLLTAMRSVARHAGAHGRRRRGAILRALDDLGHAWWALARRDEAGADHRMDDRLVLDITFGRVRTAVYGRATPRQHHSATPSPLALYWAEHGLSATDLSPVAPTWRALASHARPRRPRHHAPPPRPLPAGEAAAGVPAAAGSTRAGGSAPGGSTAAGSLSAGSTAAGSTAAGSLPAGSTAAGSLPAGSTAAGSLPAGSTVAGSLPAGSPPAGSTPAAAGGPAAAGSAPAGRSAGGSASGGPASAGSASAEAPATAPPRAPARRRRAVPGRAAAPAEPAASTPAPAEPAASTPASATTSADAEPPSPVAEPEAERPAKAPRRPRRTRSAA